MLGDHIWASGLINCDLLTIFGRIAFPIFAFLIVEGFFHTKNLNKYLQRLFVFAVVSEIPFNMIVGGSWFYPLHQNVIWTFLLGVLMLKLLEKQNNKTIFLRIVFSFLILSVFLLCASLSMVDYHAAGIMTIAIFYFLRGQSWGKRFWQLLGLYYVNFEFLGGLFYPLTIGHWHLEFPLQGFALLSLIFIWLYNGHKGYDKKWFKYACYIFYPAHLLVLALLIFIYR